MTFPKKIELLPILSPLLDFDSDFLPDSYLLGPRPPFPEKKGFSWTFPLRIFLYFSGSPFQSWPFTATPYCAYSLVLMEADPGTIWPKVTNRISDTRRRGHTSHDGDYLAHGTGIPRRNAPPKTHIKVKKSLIIILFYANLYLLEKI